MSLSAAPVAAVFKPPQPKRVAPPRPSPPTSSGMNHTFQYHNTGRNNNGMMMHHHHNNSNNNNGNNGFNNNNNNGHHPHHHGGMHHHSHHGGGMLHNPMNGGGVAPIQPLVPLGAAPLGLSPGLSPANPALLNMPSPVEDTPMSIPIQKERPEISEESIRTRMYSKEEFMSLRNECVHTPSSILEWALSMYRDGSGGPRCPPHLRLLADELEADRTGALLGGAGRKTARPVRAVHHKVMSILSRLTPQKYDVLKEELFQLPLKQLSDSELRDVVKVFFNKSVQEHKFSDLYARMVADICLMSEAESALDQATRERLLQTRMRSELLTACQEEFNRPLQLTEKDRVDPITGDLLPEEEIARKRDILKTRLVGNIKFVGELFKFHLVNPRVVSSIFRILVFDFDSENPTAKEDYMYEVFGMLLKTVGARLTHDDPAAIETVMAQVATIRDKHTSNRVRFGMMDLIDLHKQGWNTKKEVLTKEEHEYAQMEKAARDSATLDRQKAQLRAAGGSSSSNLSTPVSQMDPSKFTPMGAKQRSTGGLSGGSNGGVTTSSSTSTPVSAVRSFPAVASPSSSSPTSANYASAVASGRKMPPPAGITTTTTTTSTTGRYVVPSTPNTNGPAGTPNGTTPTAAARPSTMPQPVAPSSPTVNRESAREIASKLMTEFNDVKARPRVLHSLSDLERSVCIPVITSWIREAVLVTRLFDARENLPILFYNMVERCEDPNSMILSSSDILTTVLEWIRFDIQQKRFTECPRFFANWGAVVGRTFKLAAADQKNRPMWVKVMSILNCSTFTLSLREVVLREYRDTIVTAIRDMSAVCTQVTQYCDQMAGREPHKILSFAAMSRFRLLPYVIKADSESDCIRVPYTPSLGPAPAAQPVGMGPADPYHACFQIQQSDAELNLFKRVIRRDANGASSSIAQALDALGQNQNVTRLVTTMKLTAATLSLLNPPTQERPLIAEVDAFNLLHEAIARSPSDLQHIAQAAVVMEMVCFYCSNTNKLLGIGGPSTPSSTPGGKAQRDEGAVALQATTDTFRRWCDAGVVDRAAVLSALHSVAPSIVPSTPGTPPRMSSATLDAMDNSFSLPEPSHRVSTPLMGNSTTSHPGTPQMGAARHSGGSATNFRFDMSEMLVRNLNFISSLKWTQVLSHLQRNQ